MSSYIGWLSGVRIQAVLIRVSVGMYVEKLTYSFMGIFVYLSPEQVLLKDL